ncbi:MAG: TetR/AcrR family transcriptional regulator [Spirochaetaceae bacterium]|nr:TetR/AcrR family transcriptional regulator [Myxococcales bacterium]MCB9725063.1 TetR/AcrR family transcriptional regulator [Spirochaetaceae bacterium]HPG25095.1 helix-turn-helix domain-containing protein [Myxococcota bacterium]
MPSTSQAPLSSAERATIRLERRLGADQIERRERLLEAARGLASEGGYAAVTMRSVAERAALGLATVYRYFSSKDHLIAEVHAARGREVARALQADPPEGADARERVAQVCARLVDVVADDLELAAACVMALASGDPAASSSPQWQTMVIRPCMEAALDAEDVGDREEVCDLVGHLVFAVMVGLTTGQHSRESANVLLDAAARRILGGPRTRAETRAK